MTNEKKLCTFFWFIENYSYCWHKEGEHLASPVFTVNGLEGTAWSLQVYPRGRPGNSNTISITLRRNEDNGPDSISVYCQPVIVGKDGPFLFSEGFIKDFATNSEFGWHLEMPEAVLQRKTGFVTEDILTVGCRIFSCDGDFEEFEKIMIAPVCARTRIGVERVSFIHAVEDFSALEPNEKKTFQMRSPSKKECVVSSNVYFCDCPCCEGKVTVKIAPTTKGQILANCELSVVDTNGHLIRCLDAGNHYRDVKEIEKLSLFLTKDAILKENEKYLADDTLSLLCECIISTGIEFQQIQGPQSEVTMTANQLSTTTSGAFHFMDGLKDIYNNKFLADVELQTKTNSFPAHKLMLCAWSPVFKAMITNDLKEKDATSIQVDDLEDDTVKQLLLFLYSDHLDDLQCETAIKLYYAAEKYKIEKLKLTCSSFLRDNLTLCTAIKILVDNHDSDLKIVVADFILESEERSEELIFDSEELKSLMEAYPAIAAKAMSLTNETEEVKSCCQCC